MASLSPRVCRTCEQPKPLTEYRGVPTIYGGDGISAHCKDCLQKRREAKKARKAARRAPEPEPDHPGPKVMASPSIGYAAQLRDTDVVIWQSSDQGEQTIWLSRSEARELATFITGLDAQPVAEAA